MREKHDHIYIGAIYNMVFVKMTQQERAEMKNQGQYDHGEVKKKHKLLLLLLDMA